MGKSIAVIFGGKSNENEISVITGTMAANVLKEGENTVIPLYMSQSNQLFTGNGLADIENFRNGKYTSFPRAVVAKGGIYVLNNRLRPKKFVKIDVAINCCHGGWGEGGGVCGLFALNDIPLASAGMFESAVFMDKYLTKLILQSLGVQTVKYAYIRHPTAFEAAEKLGYPLIVKPAKLGSSIGIERVGNRQQLQAALAAAFTLDDGVVCEEFLDGRREINCAAYFAGGEVITSQCEEAVSYGDILSFDDKYAGGGKSVLPAHIPDATAQEIRRITADVYARLNMRGIVRFDFLLCGDDIYLSEVNTVPGSLAYYLLSSGFKQFYPVLQAVIAQAEEDFARAKEKKLLNTGILKSIERGGNKLNK